MKFRKNNKICFGQDFNYYQGIPSGIDFKVERLDKNKFRLIAKGYGLLTSHHNDYGNGALFPYSLTDKQIETFNKEVKTQEGVK